MRKLLLSMSILFLISVDAKSACVAHTVVKGDTLSKLAIEYYGDYHQWRIIKENNKIEDTTIYVNQKLEICQIDKDMWKKRCENTIASQLQYLHQTRKIQSITRAITSSIEEVTPIIERKYGPISPLRKLNMCKWALVTAQQESNFQFAVGSAGEIGMYQFKLDTVRLTFNEYNISDANSSDAHIVILLLDSQKATNIFLLHFFYLYKKYGRLWLAWKRFNGNGTYAQIYATKAIRRFMKLK